MTVEKQHAEDDSTDYNKRIKSFTIEMNVGLQRRIRMAASQNNLSISEYVCHILEQTVPDEENMTERQWRPLPPDIMEQVYRVRAEIMEHTKGYVFEDSAEVIRRMREERTRELEQRRSPIDRDTDTSSE